MKEAEEARSRSWKPGDKRSLKGSLAEESANGDSRDLAYRVNSFTQCPIGDQESEQWETVSRCAVP